MKVCYKVQKWAHPDLAISVLGSQAGWYVGQRCDDGSPYSRLSQEYYPSETDAVEAVLNDTWTRKPNP